MRQENVDTPGVEDGGKQTARLSTPAEGSSAAVLSGEASPGGQSSGVSV